jgi:phenylpropionate dioxygenase-like ring-hydroxylating dioxygenase large terminal subunit
MTMNAEVKTVEFKNPKRSFLMNAWYVAAISTDIVGEELFHRTILNKPVLIYRKLDGTPIAMHNRCPHRFAPLHIGKRVGDEISCLYHALQFDCEGKCTHNPHGNGLIPKAAKVQTFPLIEKYGFIWIWMGDEAADPSMLPDYGTLTDGHPNSVGHTYMHVKSNFQVILDNVMDLSHVDHVHGEIITTRGQLTPQVPKVEETPSYLRATWKWQQTPPIMIFANFLPEPTKEARHFVHVSWQSPAHIQLTIGATQDDFDDELTFKNTISQYDLHTTTPETEDTTHYFFATRRNHLEDDAEFNKFKIKAMHDAFETEDIPIIENIHAGMGTTDFFSLNPVLMSNDIAPVKFRKSLAKLVDQELNK